MEGGEGGGGREIEGREGSEAGGREVRWEAECHATVCFGSYLRL